MTKKPEKEPSRKAGERLEFLETPPEKDDDSLILWMLSLTPTERLEAAQGFAESIEALRARRRD